MGPCVTMRRSPVENLAEDCLPRGSEELRVSCDLSEVQRDFQFRDSLPFDAAAICTGNWVRLKCQYGCRNYGTSWSCPPTTPDAAQVRAILSEYRTALLLRSSIDDHTAGDDRAERQARVVHWKGTVEAEKQLFRSGYYRAFALNAGACPLCEKCSYPKPCIHPEEIRPSISSFSVDVFQTLEKLGISLKVLRDRKVTFDRYSIILVE
jgi:predicted metal-binding protein